MESNKDEIQFHFRRSIIEVNAVFILLKILIKTMKPLTASLSGVLNSGSLNTTSCLYTGVC